MKRACVRAKDNCDVRVFMPDEGKLEQINYLMSYIQINYYAGYRDYALYPARSPCVS